MRCALCASIAATSASVRSRARPASACACLSINCKRIDYLNMASSLKLPRFLLALFFCFTESLTAQDTRFPPEGELIPGPNCAGRTWPAPPRACTPEQYDLWLADITHWR